MYLRYLADNFLNSNVSNTTHRIACSFISAVFLFSAAASHATGNSESGREKSLVCQGCHGPDGNSLGPDWPHLASQVPGYIEKQLKNFRDGLRVNETMSAMAATLSNQDIADIAAYFSQQPLAIATQEQAEQFTPGKKIYKGGNTYNGVPACAGCHGPNGVGNDPGAFPRLAGQQVSYLVKTLNDFRDGKRGNDPNEIMRNIAVKLSDNEIQAVAEYISTLNPAKP